MLVKSCIALGLAASMAAAAPGGDGPSDVGSHHGDAHGSGDLPKKEGHGHKKHSDEKPDKGSKSETDGVRLLHGSHGKRRALRASSSGFNSDDVDIDIKITWCNDNTNFCQNICLNKTWGAAINDKCEATDLEWHCTCGNGKNPDADVYTFPVMHYQCQYEVRQCQNNCATGDIRCTQECQSDRNCTAANDPNAGKTAAPEEDATDGLDTAADAGTDPVNFFSAASVLSTGGYVVLTAVVAASLQILGA
ncbi:hypothetical protein GGF46_003188 [Coemansia sp. RSA 552]|nr:hypothetical protein GGF46_003188 [Coemansia sp. RSA 552]